MNVFEQSYQREDRDKQQRMYPNERLVAFIRGLPAGRVLEIGCGNGANLWMIAKEGYEAYGIDLSPSGLDMCRNLLKEHGVTASLVHGDMSQLPYEDSYFEAVVDVLSLQHTGSHNKIIDEVYRCLKPNGQFFSFHFGDKSTAAVSDTLDDIPAPLPYAGCGLVTFLNKDTTRSLLHAFTNINIETITRTYKQYLAEYLVITAQKPVV